MQSTPLVALLLACAATPASAGDAWLVAQGVNGMTVSSDAGTLTCDHGQCSIWEETRYAEARPDGVVALRDLALYDCAGGRTRTQVEIKLGVDGRVLKTVRATAESWLPVEPGSVGATTRAFACNFQSANAVDLRSGAFDAEGQHFVRLATPAPAAVTAAMRDHGSEIAVQIAATQSEDSAYRAIAAFRQKHRRALVGGLETAVEPATLKGAPVFRALVRGFATRRDANRFCAAVKAGGGDCIIRRSGDAA
jgi:hypothetical protein